VVESANQTESKGQDMAETTVAGIEGVQSLVGQHLGHSDWVEITQEQVNQFAEATGDHQWIHVDPERAKKESPFGGPIAHGYLTLSLLVPLVAQTYRISDQKMGVNYGLNKVRFPAPVPVGSKVRARVVLKEVEEVAGGLQNTLGVTIEREGGDKPVCIAEWVVRQYGG
jgi:acyl dehydratase